ncbi:Card1-like endonuclease domain-containing protein [Thermodesulfitimonas autotrophica]|uniref:Card1-like endonuclease domain-containing protein n=1 Tax=Thermodesulfitimonas autotrophica TaxID=1894989 RepID=UPI002FDFA050
MQAMIALVSEQRMQNIIPCYQKGLAFAEVHLVRSLEAEASGSALSRAWRDTKRALENTVQVRDVPPPVDAFNVSAVQAAVKAAIEQLTSKGPRVAVNFTGGTKCMSVGAFLAAKEAGCPAFYVDTDYERFLWYGPDREVEERKFDLRPITVPLYLAAYGLTYKKSDYQEELQQLSKLLDLILAFWPQCVPTLEKWAEFAKKGQKPGPYASLQPSNLFANQFVSLLLRYKLLDDKSGELNFTKRGVDFFTGGWLELTVYHLLRSHSNDVAASFDDVQWSVKAELEGVENELDVVLTRKGQLFVIECKSGDLRGPAGQATLNKLEALRFRLGRFARLIFVTSRLDSEIPAPFRARAQEYGIRQIVTRENLTRLPELL